MADQERVTRITTRRFKKMKPEEIAKWDVIIVDGILRKNNGGRVGITVRIWQAERGR